MDGLKFKDEDKDKVIKFLNFIAKKAEFKLNTNEIIEYFHLLSFMQKDLLPKIDANIFEIKSISAKKEEDK